MKAEPREHVTSKPDAAARGIAKMAQSPSRAHRPRSIRRLQIVSLLMIGIILVMWLTTNLVQGHLGEELRAVGQWGPPVTAVAASLLMFAIARHPTLSEAWILRAGLGYEVVVSFAIAFGSSYTAYQSAAAGDLTIDRVGLTWVIPWMIFFTVLVQASVREVLPALLLSASAPAVAFGVEVAVGRAPMISAGQYFLLFILPNLMGVAMTYIAARIVHELGLDVQRAHDLGSYRLESRLGQGGMGEVWRATHHTLARPAAIKIIRPDALDSEPEQARLAAVRFEREAQAIASLQSRNTVQLYDFGRTQDGTLYYVMELLDGMDLEEMVRRDGAMPPSRVVHILLQACASLAEAHRRGVIHRDVKPANIYLCREAFESDVVKILDFGLAKRIVPTPAPGASVDTRSDVIAGTPAYLAPEAISGTGTLDGRSDLYSLGCVAYWLLTGHLVFETDSAMGMMAAHLERVPTPPGALSPFKVPALLDELIMQCLSKSPDARPLSAEEVSSRLAAVELEAPWTSKDAAHWWNTHAPGLSS